MSNYKQNEKVTQSAPPWPLTPIPRQNPRLLAQDDEDASPENGGIVEEFFDIEPDVGGDNVFVEDTWPELAPVKFEPKLELDPRQAHGENAD